MLSLSRFPSPHQSCCLLPAATKSAGVVGAPEPIVRVPSLRPQVFFPQHRRSSKISAQPCIHLIVPRPRFCQPQATQPSKHFPSDQRLVLRLAMKRSRSGYAFNATTMPLMRNSQHCNLLQIFRRPAGVLPQCDRTARVRLEFRILYCGRAVPTLFFVQLDSGRGRTLDNNPLYVSLLQVFLVALPHYLLPVKANKPLSTLPPNTTVITLSEPVSPNLSLAPFKCSYGSRMCGTRTRIKYVGLKRHLNRVLVLCMYQSLLQIYPVPPCYLSPSQ
jgi:hypothetical protein